MPIRAVHEFEILVTTMLAVASLPSAVLFAFIIRLTTIATCTVAPEHSYLIIIAS